MDTTELKVGQHYRSEKTKVLMTIEKVDLENDTLHARVADSDYVMEGPASGFVGLLGDTNSRQITDDEFNEYLKTYTEDIKAQQEKERAE